MFNFDFKDLEPLQPVFDRLENKVAMLKNSRPLGASALARIREGLSMEWTYNSNSIEGNTLTLKETQMVIQEGITIGGKSLREHFEAVNHEKAIDHLYNLVDKNYGMRSIDILTLHGIIMRTIDDEYAGRIRDGGVRITGANFTPPNAAKVSALLDELIDFSNTNPLKLNDILLSTVFHHKMVYIHPFFDGNGRTARLAMNLLLIAKGWPPAIILKNDRAKYYASLNEANKGNYHKLALLMLQALERSLNIYINAMPGRGYDDYDLISNLLQEDDMPYGQEYISLLARQGKIDAYKEGRNWLTNKKAITDYMLIKEKKKGK